ncbi:MAG: lysophospholipid acyltransferase family protein [Thermodesulfobacteriota bacterium]
MVQYLIYSVIRGFGFLINLFPDGCALWIGKQLGRLAYFLDFEHRRVAMRNLALAFGGEKSGNEIRGIALRNFENLGMNFIEFLRFPGVNYEKLLEKVEMEGRSHVEEALERGKGIIFLLGHIGNWELLGGMSRVFEGNLMAIARPLKQNKRLDRFIEDVRRSSGLEVLSSKRVAHHVVSALRRTKMVGILIDQREKRSQGVGVEFFGRKASTTPASAFFALKTGAAVIPVYTIRLEGGRHRFVAEPPIELIKTGDKAEDIRINTQRHTEVVESIIRRYPDQWFWIHRRWERKQKDRTRSRIRRYGKVIREPGKPTFLKDGRYAESPNLSPRGR